MKFTSIASVIAVAAFSFGATAAHAQSKDIVEIAMSDPQFSTLVKAVKAAGLVNTLKGPGPFTVFAPTNAAFAKVPPATLKKLLADKPALAKLLTYHVVSGKILSTDLKPMTAKSVAGPGIMVRTSPAPMVNNAKIIKADIEASNGVIHVIDTVIMPGVGMAKPMMKKPMSKMGNM